MDRDNRKVIVVAGLAWGDESKGACVDWLCREHGAKLIVRYNGGCQAAHTVCLPDGKHHTFAQFGSGTLIPNVRTYLSSFMMVNPITMIDEERHLQGIGITDAFDRTSVSQHCLVTTPFDKALNRIKENALGKSAHGSCGVGIGETKQYNITYGDEALFVRDLRDATVTRLKLRLKQARAIEASKKWCLLLPDDRLYTKEFSDDLAMAYFSWTFKISISDDYTLRDYLMPRRNGKPVDICAVFEGAQGVLLDERDEFLPHNTWTKTTFENADTLLRDAGYTGEVKRVGCLRSYMTRHGVGPFPTEDVKLAELAEPHNNDSGFQGKFRRGHFDMASVKHALDICGGDGIDVSNGVDEIHMSHIDQLPQIYPNIDTESYVNNIERLLETPITVTGHGPTAEDRRKRYVEGIIARRRSTQASTGIPCSTSGKS